MTITYSINGITFASLGIGVKASDGVTSFLERKESLTTEWNDYHGETISLSRPRYKPREISLSCWIKADDPGDFLNKLAQLRTELTKTGTQRLMVQFDAIVLVYEVYQFDAIDITKKWRPTTMIGEFTLRLREPQPVKEIIQFIRTTGNTALTIQCTSPYLLSVHWGDGESTHNLSGALNLSHSYADDGIYFAILSGNIEDITGLTTNGTVMYTQTGQQPQFFITLQDTEMSIYDEYPPSTKATLRALNWNDEDMGTSVQPAYYLTDMQKAFRYSATETGTDNNSTILVDAAGHRWVETSVYKELYLR